MKIFIILLILIASILDLAIGRCGEANPLDYIDETDTDYFEFHYCEVKYGESV